MCWNWKLCSYRLEAVVERKCQTLSAGTAAENEYVPCCVALRLHRQLYGEQILLLVLFWCLGFLPLN